MSIRSTLLLAHRGARHYAPENTIPAFDLALEHGVEGFEFDVRCTRDRQAVLCHDAKLHRLVIRRHTLEQLASRGSGLRPPTLEEVLERYSRRAFLNIEVKVRGMEELVALAVKRTRPPRYLITSFLPSVIRNLYRMDSSLVLGALAQTRWQLRRWTTLPAAYVVPNYRLLSPELVAKLHGAGKLVITWTVNTRNRMLRAAELGVDGIISDDTRLLAQTLGEKARSA